jgi:hypothetical protein
MIEIFKTDVDELLQAEMLLKQIHKNFPGYRANFDLNDCDNILRVQTLAGPVDSRLFIKFLKEFDVCAEVLPDEPQPVFIPIHAKRSAFR